MKSREKLIEEKKALIGKATYLLEHQPSNTHEMIRFMSRLNYINGMIIGYDCDKKELQDAYDIAMGEINNLRAKLGYNKEGLISPSSQEKKNEL